MTLENSKTQERIAGLIYSGGRGVRMGGVDKAFLDFHGKPLIEIMSQTLGNFVEIIFITRQADQDDVSSFGVPVIDKADDQGPLCGLASAIPLARKQGFEFLLSVAVDGTSLPKNYLKKMQMNACPHSMAKTNGQIHPTYSFINLAHSNEIIQSYESGARALRSWASAENCHYVDFATDDFGNLNQK